MKQSLKAMQCAVCVFVFLFMAVACSTDDEPEKGADATKSPTPTVQAQDKTFSLNETAAFNNIKVTANAIEKSQGNDLYKPDNGKVFVGVKFTIENISQEDQTISSMLLFTAYADDVKCDYSISASLVFGDGTLDGTISPGKKMMGYYAVEVPADTKKLEFEVKPSWLGSSKATFALSVPK